MPLKSVVISCSVLEDEVQALVKDMPHIIEVSFLEIAQHDFPEKLQRNLQNAIEWAEKTTDCEAIIFIYGLCSQALLGLHSSRAKLVMPRAHDCITLFLGSRKEYARIQKEQPGTYWYSPGWNKARRVPGPDKFRLMREQLMEKYDDEDDVDFLMETERDQYNHYHHANYVDLGIGDCDKEADYAKSCADHLGWKFHHLKGDISLVRDLLEGNWDDERYLIVEPGQTAAMSYDDSIIKSCPCKQ